MLPRCRLRRLKHLTHTQLLRILLDRCSTKWSQGLWLQHRAQTQRDMRALGRSTAVPVHEHAAARMLRRGRHPTVQLSTRCRHCVPTHRRRARHLVAATRNSRATPTASDTHCQPASTASRRGVERAYYAPLFSTARKTPWRQRSTLISPPAEASSGAGLTADASVRGAFVTWSLCLRARGCELN
jgi:hypothetical protein